MTRKITIKNLPLGAGAALGSFVRSTYLTASQKYAIMGMKINDCCLCDMIGNTTVIASDVILLLTGTLYELNPTAITEQQLVSHSDIGDIYKLTASFKGITQLSRSDFKAVYSAPEDKTILFSEPVDITISLYICKVTGIIKESISAVCLQSIAETNIIPVVCDNKTPTNCWHTIESHKFSEDLTIHMESPIKDPISDLNALKTLTVDYISYFIEASPE